MIDELVNVFGHDVVFSTSFDYMLNEDDCIKIYSILNKYLFNNKLKMIEIHCWPEDKIVERLNANKLNSDYDDKAPRIDAPCYGVASGICKCVKDSSGKLVDIDILDDVIMMNVSRLTACTFIFAVACICHEMIHYYDSMTRQYHDNYVEASVNGSNFDSHEDDAFVQKSDEAAEHGIDIEKDLSWSTYENTNRKARCFLHQRIGESEDDGINVFDNGHTLIISNMKTDISFFAHFD